jgi:cell fate (sporulation/competence/biofilm development) regulator YlbF (YheA/YmcA/DUF963 family)
MDVMDNQDENTHLLAVLDELVDAMKNSEEYKRFKKAEAKVHEFPGMQSKIDAFRKGWYTMQANGAPDLFVQTDYYEAKHADFRENPYVQEYLAAELAVCRMYQQVNWTIMQNLDFDTDFLQN